MRSTSCLVLLWGFRGRQIEWRYFRSQDGGQLGKLKWRYLREGHPIYSVFGLMVGFSRSADRIAAISSWTKFNKCVGENSA